LDSWRKQRLIGKRRMKRRTENNKGTDVIAKTACRMGWKQSILALSRPRYTIDRGWSKGGVRRMAYMASSIRDQDFLNTTNEEPEKRKEKKKKSKTLILNCLKQTVRIKENLQSNERAFLAYAKEGRLGI
jgi:hypothetical protein